jgi:dUTP pyrophosphatase
MSTRQVKIINQSGNPLPAYETIHAAGLDLRAHLNQDEVLKPMQRKLIPTGLFIELPDGCEAQIRPRSGLAFKNGITVLNSPGTIDADYRGEIKVLLINLSDQPVMIRNGDRIAQMVVAPYIHVVWDETNQLGGTDRGAGGFGHTGTS